MTAVATEVASSEGLRAVLTRIHAAGSTGWHGREAAELLIYTRRRYEPIAASWGRDPDDALHAAFLAMRAEGLLRAEDPWAVVTQAVRLSVIAEAQAERMLISPEAARRPELRPAHAPVLAGDDRQYLYDLGVPEAVADESPRTPTFALEAAAYLAVCGWPVDLALAVVEYVASRAAERTSRATALDVLHRDAAGRGQFGIEQDRWLAVVSLLVGTRQGPAGLLARFILGDSAADVLDDASLARLRERVTW